MTSAAIRQNRIADARVSVVADGHGPLALQEVVVTQRSHAFKFGCAGFDAIALANDELDGERQQAAEQLQDLWLDVFNLATLPFYWARFEAERGRPDTERIRRTARWFRDRGCAVKGHPLCWHTLTPSWLTPLPTAEVRDVLRGRIEREVTGFAGLIDTWDAINEAVIMPVFEKEANAITRLAQSLGRVGTVRLAFEAARSANPDAKLILNDFDTSVAYERLIEECLGAGIRIDVLGIQSHMHQGYWGIDRTLDVLERFSRFGLPIHFTESTLISGDLMPAEIVDLNDYAVDEWPSTPDGEARQAEEVATHYTTLVAHPSVEAVTWWDLADGGWLNAPAGLVRRDGTPKPAYEALRQLVKADWWLAPTTKATDENGILRFAGFLGEYELSWGGRTATIVLDQPGSVEASAVFSS